MRTLLCMLAWTEGIEEESVVSNEFSLPPVPRYRAATLSDLREVAAIAHYWFPSGTEKIPGGETKPEDKRFGYFAKLLELNEASIFVCRGGDRSYRANKIIAYSSVIPESEPTYLNHRDSDFDQYRIKRSDVMPSGELAYHEGCALFYVQAIAKNPDFEYWLPGGLPHLEYIELLATHLATFLVTSKTSKFKLLAEQHTHIGKKMLEQFAFIEQVNHRQSAIGVPIWEFNSESQKVVSSARNLLSRIDLAQKRLKRRD